ncbi:hypothetical protein [Nocardia concava]|uniref:hypothetical protein n=1 Tax=Nocardia concava TaxID=257281 RepID=UPI000301854E|nr:hypothetical protein [Nocardia concava]
MQRWVTICLPPDAIDDVESAITQALAPFGMRRGFPKRDMRDTWQIHDGGAGAGFYVRPGHEDDPRLIHDGPNQFGITLLPTRGECAGGPKSLLNVPIHNMSEPDILTLDGWWIEQSGLRRHKDSPENPSVENQFDRPSPPPDIENYLDTLPDDTVLVRVCCHS